MRTLRYLFPRLIMSFFIFGCFVLPTEAEATDATWNFTKTVGGTGDDWPSSTSVDDAGNVYISGIFNGAVDFDPSTSTDNRTSAGAGDAFLSKYSSDGTYLWTKTFGGTGNDSGKSVTLDSIGNLYFSGYFGSASVDFDPGSGVDTHSAVGTDTFLSKYSSDGTYLWTKTVGSEVVPQNMTIDSSDNVYLTGYYSGTVDFDPGSGVDNHTSNLGGGNNDVFLSKYSSDGTYQWTNTIGGVGGQYGYSVAVDVDGYIYLAGGYSNAVDFDPGIGVDNHTPPGGAGTYDAFLSKYTSDGSYQWTKTVGGTDDDWGYSVTLDSSGSLYFAGDFHSTVDFDPGSSADNHTSNGGYDVFFSKYSSDGTYLWTKTFGGTGYDDLAYYDQPGLVIDNQGNVYLAGLFEDTVDFDPSSGIDEHTSNGSNDVSLSSYDQDGNYRYTQTWGGTDYDEGLSLASYQNTLYVVGDYTSSSVDFDPSSGTDIHTGAGSYDIFLSSFTIGTDPVSSDSDTLERADIDSWQASLLTDQSSCPNKLKLTIKGKHFDNDAEVFIGGKKAPSVNVSNSKKLSARFCLPKLLKVKNDLKRTVSVKNPDTDSKKADKKIDLSLYSFLVTPPASLTFNQDTKGGILNIQKYLVTQKLLDKAGITGVYDFVTREAVKVFQSKHDIPQTGNVGPRTREAMEK